jgi:hypothetical protein
VLTKYRQCRLSFNKEAENRILLVPNKDIRLSFFDGNSKQEVDNGVVYVNGSKFYDEKTLLKKLKEHKNGEGL